MRVVVTRLDRIGHEDHAAVRHQHVRAAGVTTAGRCVPTGGVIVTQTNFAVGRQRTTKAMILGEIIRSESNEFRILCITMKHEQDTVL